MKRLVRSNDKKIAGVCGGVAEYFGWNVRNVRLIWAIAAFIGVGSPVLFYLILWLLMPESSLQESYAERLTNRLKK